MKQYQICYKDCADFETKLAEIKTECGNKKYSAVTFYITWTKSSQDELDTVTGLLEQYFPDAPYYGNESSGNISMGRLVYGLHVTCCLFENQKTKTELLWVQQGTKMDSLKALWSYCRGCRGLRAVELIPSITYLDTLGMEGNEVTVDEDIFIFGGASVNYDDATFVADVIAKGHPKTKEGMAVMLYYGDDISFSMNSVLGWKGLGQLMKVTASTGKCITQIENKPAFHVYEKYLDLTVEDNDALVFPLLVNENGVEFIRTPQLYLPDKSMQMFADVPEGSMVRVAYGDKNSILNSIYEKAMEIADFRPEAIKVYSCCARRLFWGDGEVGKETEILQELAPVCGFYTGGEIIRFNHRLKVMNQTLSVVSLRENSTASVKKNAALKRKKPDKSLVSRLAYFAEAASRDQEAALKKVEEQQEQLEEQRLRLEEALSLAQSASRAKTEFLFNMSHDIRTPMNAILGYTDIALRHSGEQDKVDDSLKKIKISGGHLLKLINDILEMSRIEAGKLEIVNVPLNSLEAIEGINHMGRALAATKDITFTAEVKGLKNPYIYADELHTNQVIINLISNAIKYTDPGGKVEYQFEQISDPIDRIANYRITVRDNGIGMSDEFQQHLFESFSREESATVSRQEGAGLGLAIVKKIVNLIGGTIHVQSKKDIGSTFIVELPLEVMDIAAIERFTAERSKTLELGKASVLEGKKVLLVEDNDMNREIAEEMLKDAGLNIDTAEDGDIAVKKVTKKGAGYYDFILMDIQMPVMNGYEATKAIRRLPEGGRVPVIALSANAFKEDVEKSLEAGMNAHVAKPVDIQTLCATMNALNDSF